MSLSLQRYISDERLRARIEADARRERAGETHRLLGILVARLRERLFGRAAGRREAPRDAACAGC